MKIYLVTTGEYSDYSIVAAYKTRELAEQALDLEGADWRKYDSVRIEEFALITNLRRVEVWQANNDMYGKWRTHVEKVYAQDTDQTEEKAWTHYSTHDKKIWANGRAMTEERALKIARDAYAKAKAEKAGL